MADTNGNDRVLGLKRLAQHTHTLEELAKLTRACQRGLSQADDDTSGLSLATTVLAAFRAMSLPERASFASDLMALGQYHRTLMAVVGLELLAHDGRDVTYTRWRFPLEG